MKLVIGASGFVGSHVVRQLVERGEDVRVLLRATSSTHAIDDLDVERRYGDFVDDSLRAHIMSPMDHGKASRELGWEPEPIHEAIHKAVAFYLQVAQRPV